MPLTLGTACTALGYIVGAVVLWCSARSAQWPPRTTLWLLLAGLTGGVVGGKLAQWLALGWPWQMPAQQLADPALGGRTILGGIVCGWLAVEFAKRRLGVRSSTGALFAFALPAGEAVGRMGCLLNACCYGAPSALPWAVYQHSAWRHPAQAYSALAALGILLVLLWLKRRGLARDAALFQWYLLLYGASRFMLEFLRHRDQLYAGLSVAQWFSLELALGGGVMLWVGALRRQRTAGDTDG